MWECFKANIVADDITELENNLLSLLLFDRSSRKNIIWTTKNLLLFYLMSQIEKQEVLCYADRFCAASVFISSKPEYIIFL